MLSHFQKYEYCLVTNCKLSELTKNILKCVGVLTIMLRRYFFNYVSNN